MLNFSETSVIGFSGSRAPSAASVQELRLVLAALPSDISVAVGCAIGLVTRLVVKENARQFRVFNQSRRDQKMSKFHNYAHNCNFHLAKRPR